MKKTIATSMVLLTVLSTFAILAPSIFTVSAPRQVASSSSWAIKQLTKNDVDDVLCLYALSRDGSRIVFDRRPSSLLDHDIYAMNTTDEPGQEKQMTTAYGEDTGSAISGDGSKITFASGRFHLGDPWDLEIFVMNFTDNPGQEIQASDNSSYLDGDEAISGDGEIIAWHYGPTSYSGLNISIVNMTAKSRITIDVGDWDEYPSVSYDGRKISFISDGDIYLVNSDGTGLRQITNTAEREDLSLISGDGTKIAFRRGEKGSGNCEIFVYDIVHNTTTQLTNNSVDEWFGSINYDGSIVAYDREGHVFIHNMTHEIQLTDGPYTDESPRIDGDGDTIAFRSRGRDGPDAEIFLMQRPSTPAPPRQLIIKLSGAHDYLPRENIKVKIAALVADAEDKEPVSGANVTITIDDPEGNLWVSDVMTEKLNSGVYLWESNETVREIFRNNGKGIYVVKGEASIDDGPTASDILTFHIDPPPASSLPTIIGISLAAIATVVLVAVFIKRKRNP